MEPACAGSLMWMLEAPRHPDYDNFTVYTAPGPYVANSHIHRGIPPPQGTDNPTGLDFYNRSAP